LSPSSSSETARGFHASSLRAHMSVVPFSTVSCRPGAMRCSPASKPAYGLAPSPYMKATRSERIGEGVKKEPEGEV